MITIYGIPNCDTMKKAMTWLASKNLEFEFHNYKKSGISSQKVTDWLSQTNWEVLVNRKGTTWKKLTTEQQLSINSEEKARDLMVEHTSLIKRPIVELEGVLAGVGFDETAWQKLFF